MSEQIVFYNKTLNRKINLEELIGEIKNYVNEKPDAEYQITIGTDSPGTTKPVFTTAVTVLRIGNGGRYFWTKSKEFNCPTLRERIYKETMQSITLTQEMKSRLKKEFGENFFWPDKLNIHIDVGKKGPTKDLVDGIVGMVKGYGFEAIIKPYAFCASVVADRHT